MPEKIKQLDHDFEGTPDSNLGTIEPLPLTRTNPFTGSNTDKSATPARPNPFGDTQIPMDEPARVGPGFPAWSSDRTDNLGEDNFPDGINNGSTPPPDNSPPTNPITENDYGAPGVIVPQGVAKTQPENDLQPLENDDKLEPSVTPKEWRYSKPELHYSPEIAREAQRALSGEEPRTDYTGHERHIAESGFPTVAESMRDGRLTAGQEMADGIKSYLSEVARQVGIPTHDDGSFMHPPIVLTEPPFTPSKRQVNVARRLPKEYIPEGLRFSSGEPDARLVVPEGVDLGDLFERAGIDPFTNGNARVLTPSDLHKIDPFLADGKYDQLPFVHDVIEPLAALRQDGHRWHPADPDINPDKYGLPRKFADVAAPPKSRGDTHILLPSSPEGEDLARRMVGDRSYGRWGSPFGDPRSMSEVERDAWHEFADRGINRGQLPFHIFPIEYKGSVYRGPTVILPDEITHGSARSSDVQHRYLDDVAYGVGAAGSITRAALDRGAALDSELDRNSDLDAFFAAKTTDERRKALLPVWRTLAPLRQHVHPILGHFNIPLIDKKQDARPPLFGIREDFDGGIRTRVIPVTSDAVFRRLFEPDGFNRAVYERIARMHKRGEI